MKGLVAYILVGLPGSGKSTWIKQQGFDQYKNFSIVSSDNIIEDFAHKEGKTYTEVFDKYIGRASKMMKEYFREALLLGNNIIWDQTNMSKKKRRGILKQLPNEYKKVAVILDVSDKELQQRLENRELNEGKHIPQHVILNMAKSYQRPTLDEGFDEIIEVKGK